jgi:hypothetical protein
VEEVNPPNETIAEARLAEEPGAVVPYAGICAGGGQLTALSTAMAAGQIE